MKKIAFLILTFSVAILLNSCDKCKDTACFTPPTAIRIKLVNQSGQNISSSFDSVTITYIENGSIKPITVNKVKTETDEQFYNASEIGWITTDKEIDFDLKVNQVSKGTLTIKERSVNQDCCTFVEVEKITFKGNSLFNKLDKDYCYNLAIE